MSTTSESSSYDKKTSALPLGKPRNCLRSIGKLDVTILVLGTLIITAAVGFLASFWLASFRAAQGHAPPKLWIWILESDWAAPSITLTAVFIRAAVTTQAGVVTAMLAALYFESGHIKVTRFPHMSIYRAISPAPYQLLGPAWVGGSGWKSRAFLTILMGLVLTSLVAQFASTILLQDFGTYNVPLNTTTSEVTYTLLSSSPFDLKANNYWRSNAPSYPRFAEYAEHAPALGPDVLDTGRLLRAMPPFGSQIERTALRKYSGPAFVMDARTVCVSPDITFTRIENINDPGGSYTRLTGTIGVTHDHASLRNVQRQSFICTQVSGPTICSIKPVAALWPTLEDGRGYMTLNLLLLDRTPFSDDSFSSHGQSLTELHSTTSGVWRAYHAPNSPASINASLCFINPHTEDYNVTLSSSTSGLEPVVSWDSNSKSFNTTSVRHFYGAQNQMLSTADRGLLALQNHQNWSAARTFGESGSIQMWTSLIITFRPNSTDGFLIDTSNTTPRVALESTADPYSISATHSDIVKDILKTTENPALALSTFFTILIQMIYFDYYQKFDKSAPAVFSFASVVNGPRRWAGFASVVAMLSLHIIIVGLIVVMFIFGTEQSQLGNAWQAVAQAVRPETTELLDYAVDKTDREVELVVKASGRASGSYNLVAH